MVTSGLVGQSRGLGCYYSKSNGKSIEGSEQERSSLRHVRLEVAGAVS